MITQRKPCWLNWHIKLLSKQVCCPHKLDKHDYIVNYGWHWIFTVLTYFKSADWRVKAEHTHAVKRRHKRLTPPGRSSLSLTQFIDSVPKRQTHSRPHRIRSSGWRGPRDWRSQCQTAQWSPGEECRCWSRRSTGPEGTKQLIAVIRSAVKAAGNT